jgi:hypothetical protein
MRDTCGSLFIKFTFRATVRMTDPSLDSHTMMVVGSILQIFSMFMLSLAHQESYYEVRVHDSPHLARAFTLVFL